MRCIVVWAVVLALALAPGAASASDDDVAALPSQPGAAVGERAAATATVSTTTGEIAPAGALRTVRGYTFTATVLDDGRVLFVGGVVEAEVWDPETGLFTPAGSMAMPRYDHSATLLPDGRVLVVGGWGGEPDGDGSYPNVEIRQPETNDFMPAGTLAVSRGRPSVTRLADGSVLIAGGADTDDRPGAILERWHPARTAPRSTTHGQ